MHHPLKLNFEHALMLKAVTTHKWSTMHRGGLLVMVLVHTIPMWLCVCMYRGMGGMCACVRVYMWGVCVYVYMYI